MNKLSPDARVVSLGALLPQTASKRLVKRFDVNLMDPTRECNLTFSAKPTGHLAGRAVPASALREQRSNHGPVQMEVNSSPGLEGIEHATGRDVAGMMIEYIEKHAKAGKTRNKGVA